MARLNGEASVAEDLIAWVSAAIEQTEKIARAAEVEAPGPWIRGHREYNPKVDTPDGQQIYDSARDVVVYDEGQPGPASVGHIVHNNPADTLRRCEADRRLLDQVQTWRHEYVDGDPWFSCAQAVDDSGAEPGSGCADDDRAGQPCDCPTGTHIKQVMAALAARYGITTEEIPA
jgi:hypothetical protein